MKEQVRGLENVGCTARDIRTHERDLREANKSVSGLMA